MVVGSVIDDRYRLEEEAGRGGMAVVYRATHLKLQKTVALKLMSPTLAVDPEFQRRFEVEARAASEIDHEHVIPVYDFGEDGCGLYLVMCYIEGSEPSRSDERARCVRPVARCPGDGAGRLRARCRARPRPASPRCEARERLVEDSTSRIFLADFGLVRSSHADDLLEGESTAIGTEWYTAPERRNREETKLGDVYSLGCVLWEMLAGPGHRCPSATPMGASSASAALRQVVLTAVSKRPHERFHSAGGLARAARTALAPGATGVPPGRTASRSTSRSAPGSAHA